MRLPEWKLARLHQALQSWAGLKVCLRCELESLVGLLHHAFRVIRPGLSFLRQIIDLLRIPRHQHHQLPLNRQFRADLRWWLTASRWNGIALFPPTTPAKSQVVFLSKPERTYWSLTPQLDTVIIEVSSVKALSLRGNPWRLYWAKYLPSQNGTDGDTGILQWTN